MWYGNKLSYKRFLKTSLKQYVGVEWMNKDHSSLLTYSVQKFSKALMVVIAVKCQLLGWWFLSKSIYDQQAPSPLVITGGFSIKSVGRLSGSLHIPIFALAIGGSWTRNVMPFAAQILSFILINSGHRCSYVGVASVTMLADKDATVRTILGGSIKDCRDYFISVLGFSNWI